MLIPQILVISSMSDLNGSMAIFKFPHFLHVPIMHIIPYKAFAVNTLCRF